MERKLRKTLSLGVSGGAIADKVFTDSVDLCCTNIIAFDCQTSTKCGSFHVLGRPVICEVYDVEAPLNAATIIRYTKIN